MKLKNPWIATSRYDSVCDKEDVGMTSKMDDLILSCVSRPDMRRWSTFFVSRCMQVCPERRVRVKQGTRPLRQDGWTLTGNNQGSPMCARDGTRRNIRHTQVQSETRRRRRWTRWKSRETCPRETGNASIKTRCMDINRGQPGKPKVRARWDAKEYKTHASSEWNASTSPLDALKVVLSEVATG